MACEAWSAKLDLYVDGELTPAEAREFGSHLPTCAACAADTLDRVQMKRLLASAGKRYEPSNELRARIAKSIAPRPQNKGNWLWSSLALPAALILIVVVGLSVFVNRESARRSRVYSELADLHVAALASTTPVDVVSSDRHTVKPWFQGKIPFTFNLPELRGSEFTLIGGRMAYLAQRPGAQLIFQLRKHEISVFIFQDHGEETVSLPSGSTHAASFNMNSWMQDGLRYFVVGDVNANDIDALCKLLRDAG